ncbi:MAG: haloacid dehalogenase [Dehalococcoidales bacterium]|nr:MAG: haloacid dehalogenase [Dehalococcoidales bacterium]
MTRLTDNLDEFAEHIRATLSVRDAAREKLLPLCRDAIRYCSSAIRAIHRQEIDSARTQLQSARDLISEAEKIVAAESDLGRMNIVRDAQKEYVEGNVVLALITGKQTPGPEGLGVEPVAYLHGLSDAVGELRRYLLDSMRKGDLSRGEEFLAAMDDIYNILVTMDFPDALTGGLRRTTDVVRGILERTRSDLTLTIRQGELENRLRKYDTEKEEKD